ncbi:MAG: hypothetical protein M3P23_00735 [Actinomycetota bacterium]|nr:hypothetical protein [Actinomycetota bacterium]
MDDADFFSWYGHWTPLRPTEVADLLGGGFPYWIVGGWAIEAFTGRSRDHDDIDVTFLARDFDAVRERLRGYHLWDTNDGVLRPLLPGAAMPEEEGQMWLRKDAASPWLVDLLLTPAEGDDWVCKRDRRIRRPLTGIGWTGAEGAPYLRPEIVLLMKAKHDQPKDRADLEAALPMLDPAARAWLADSLRVAHPGHPWLETLAGNSAP